MTKKGLLNFKFFKIFYLLTFSKFYKKTEKFNSVRSWDDQEKFALFKTTQQGTYNN